MLGDMEGQMRDFAHRNQHIPGMAVSFSTVADRISGNLRSISRL